MNADSSGCEPCLGRSARAVPSDSGLVKSQVSSATGGARIVQSVTTERHAALDLGQAFSRFRPMLKIKDLIWCHRSEVRMATWRLNRADLPTQREQNSRWRPHNGN